MMRRLFFLALMLHAAALAQPVAIPAQPQPQFQQNLGARLPLDEVFADERGWQRELGAYFGRQPVVLVLGYYHCPNLCSTLMEGVLESLADVGLAQHTYRVLGVSIDPSETVELAARKKASHAAMVARAGGELQLLTGLQPQIQGLAQAAGFQYRYDASAKQYVHPAGFMIVTPDGRISHYFMGVRFDPRDVRLALVDASGGRIGSPIDRLLLLCSHYDPSTGRYSGAAMTLVRAASLAALAVLAGWIWRQRTAKKEQP